MRPQNSFARREQPPLHVQGKIAPPRKIDLAQELIMVLGGHVAFYGLEVPEKAMPHFLSCLFPALPASELLAYTDDDGWDKLLGRIKGLTCARLPCCFRNKYLFIGVQLGNLHIVDRDSVDYHDTIENYLKGIQATLAQIKLEHDKISPELRLRLSEAVKDFNTRFDPLIELSEPCVMTFADDCESCS